MRLASMLTTLLLTAPELASAAPSAAQVEISLAKVGPKATIAGLVATGEWDAAVDEISRGDAVWIALAPALAPGADAGTAEDLGISLAFALPRNAAAVLAAVGDPDPAVFNVEEVCGLPFIEDTVKDRAGYRRTAIAAVSGVANPRLGAVKNLCLAILESTR